MLHEHFEISEIASMLVLLWIAGQGIISDLRCRRIPNLLIWRGIAVALVIQFCAINTQTPTLAGAQWWSGLAGMAVGLLALMPLYLLRACGAGDVKLMAMVGAFVGPATVLDAALCTLVAGGALSLVFMLCKGISAQTLGNVRFIVTDVMVRARTGGGARIEPLATTAGRLPYAVAIVTGTFAALLLRHGAASGGLT